MCVYVFIYTWVRVTLILTQRRADAPRRAAARGQPARRQGVYVCVCVHMCVYVSIYIYLLYVCMCVFMHEQALVSQKIKEIVDVEVY